MDGPMDPSARSILLILIPSGLSDCFHKQIVRYQNYFAIKNANLAIAIANFCLICWQRRVGMSHVKFVRFSVYGMRFRAPVVSGQLERCPKIGTVLRRKGVKRSKDSAK